MHSRRTTYERVLAFLLPALLVLAFCLNAGAAHAAQVDLKWDPPLTDNGTPATNVGGYKVYRGTSPKSYSQSFNAGTVTSYTDSSLIDGTTYYFAVTAYDNNGEESDYSNEISKQVAASGGGQPSSPAVPKSGWKLVYADSQETKAADRAAVYAFDNNPATLWITDWATTNAPTPHEIQIDLGAPYDLDSMSYTPPQDGSVNGRVLGYEFYVSDSTSNWGTPVVAGTFINDATVKTVTFNKKNGRYIRLRALSEVNGNPWTSAAEIGVTGVSTSTPPPIYTIAATAGTGGAIVPTGTVATNGGTNQSFTITPAAGYRIAGVTVDGATVGAVGSYTFSNLAANHTIAASFAVNTYTITASSTTGGTISPAGTTTVNQGAGQTYTMTAATGYELSDVKVNGTSVGRTASYTFSSVTANQTIAATFAPVVNGIAKNGWKLIYTDSEETKAANRAAVNAIDGNTATMWITDWTTSDPDPGPPHEVQIDLGQNYDLNSFSYLPPQDGSVNGRIAKYEFYVSDSTGNWGTAVSSGTFANDATRKTVTFTTKKGRYIRLRALSEVNGNPWTSMAELDVTGSPAAATSSAIPVTNWKLVYTDSQETKAANRAAVNAFDGNTASMWITDWTTTNPDPPPPHEVQIDLGQSYNLDSFSYLPPQDGSVNGRIAKYEFYVSDSTTNWGTAVASGTFVNDATKKSVSFAGKKGRYIRLRALSEVNGNPWTSAAEIGVTGTP